MKILVFSDSHSNVSNMIDVITACQADTDFIVHLGDMCSDFKIVTARFPDIRFVSVKGNNDFFEMNVPSEYIGVLSGINCLFTHGHQYSVKSGITGISVRARALKSELVLFGHTHVPHNEKKGHTLFFNPGSIGCGGVYTFGIIHINDSNILSADVLKYDPMTKQIDFFRSFK